MKSSARDFPDNFWQVRGFWVVHLDEIVVGLHFVVDFSSILLPVANDVESCQSNFLCVPRNYSALMIFFLHIFKSLLYCTDIYHSCSDGSQVFRHNSYQSQWKFLSSQDARIKNRSPQRNFSFEKDFSSKIFWKIMSNLKLQNKKSELSSFHHNFLSAKVIRAHFFIKIFVLTSEILSLRD